MAEKKKSTPKTPFEKIGAAYESEAKRQEKNKNPEMASRTRQAAGKSMTKENQRAYEEDTQSAKESKVASKKSKSKGTSVAKPKADAVGAAGAKAKNAVDAADYRSSKGKDAESQRDTDREFDRLEAGDKEKEPARPSFGSVSEQREKNPPPKSEYPNFGSVKEQREKNPPPGNAGYSFGSVAEQRAKAGPVEPSKLRAGPEGTSGMSKGTKVGANDITKEMPATARDKDAERTSRIKELSGVSTDPSDKGKMPDAPPARTKPTVLITPNDKGEMPTPKADKPGFMDRLRGRVKSFTTPAAGGAPPAPPTPPSGSGGGVGPTGPMGPKGPAGPAPEPEVSSTLDTKDGKQSQSAPAGASYSFGDQAGGAQRNVGSRAQQGENSQMSGGDSAGRDVNKGNKHTQNINAGYGPVTATTSGRATGSGKGGVTASTTGTASSHPRAANATRGGRPTSRKK